MPTKFTPRCYAFIQNEEGAVLVLRELWSGVHLNKLPGGGQEVGEGMHECLNREIEEEFSLRDILALRRDKKCEDEVYKMLKEGDKFRFVSLRIQSTERSSF